MLLKLPFEILSRQVAPAFLVKCLESLVQSESWSVTEPVSQPLGLILCIEMGLPRLYDLVATGATEVLLSAPRMIDVVSWPALKHLGCIHVVRHEGRAEIAEPKPAVVVAIVATQEQVDILSHWLKSQAAQSIPDLV